jgi:phosphatidylserine synthase
VSLGGKEDWDQNVFMPAIGFLTGCLVFSIAGVILLQLFGMSGRIAALVCFVGVAMPAAAVTAWLYGIAFADRTGNLVSSSAVVGFVLSILVGGSAGGLGAVALLNRLLPPNLPLQRT